MLQTLRLSMSWMHTWFGLVLGYVLMVVFFFGSLAVFDREIDRWAMPHTRFEAQPLPSFDQIVMPLLLAARPDAKTVDAARAKSALPDEWKPKTWMVYSGHRDPVVFGGIAFESKPVEGTVEDRLHGDAEPLFVQVDIDPRTGTVLPNNYQAIGSGWFYPLHFMLQLQWRNLGIWIVGLAALAMMAALVSGVVIHQKLFREFFTFRPTKAPQRSMLDLHNLTGVVALPFHFLFAFSGLVIFADTYLPAADHTLAQQVEARTQADALTHGLPATPAGVPTELASVDAMVAEAERRWAARGMPGTAMALTVTHVGDANAYVSVLRNSADRVATQETLHFDGASGRVLYEEPASLPVATAQGYIAGLHLIGFKHWTLRWLYFIGGLASCVCIATGFLFFVDTRRHRHATQGTSGVRWVDALAVTTVTGMLIATLAMLVVNRLLPVELADRSGWEINAFWGAWVLALIHAAWRTAPVREAQPAPAWAEQCWAVAALSLAAVLLNWITTGDHLGKTILSGYWPVAGVDLTLLVSAALAAWAALRLQRGARLTAMIGRGPLAERANEHETETEAHHA